MSDKKCVHVWRPARKARVPEGLITLNQRVTRKKPIEVCIKCGAKQEYLEVVFNHSAKWDPQLN